jgi:CubicO group peptidase (beta-lactamase class C family)
VRIFKFLLLLVFCSGYAAAQIFNADTLKYYAAPAAQGIDSDIFCRLYSYLNAYNGDIRSVVVIKNGYIISESYKCPIYKEFPQNLYSASKQVMALLTGIAIKEGFIKSEEEAVADIIPATTINNNSPYWKELKIKHLLMMTSGFRPGEPDSFKTCGEVFQKITFSAKPGEVFNYNELDPQLLVAVIEQASKMDVKQFAEKYLLSKLNIHSYQWLTIKGECNGGSGLRLKALDMAKLGWLLTDEGKWNNEQIIGKDFWIRGRESSDKYDWTYWGWKIDNQNFCAIGHDGQYIYCSPNRKFCCVITSLIPDTFRTAFIKTLSDTFFTKFDTVLIAGDTSKYAKNCGLMDNTLKRVQIPQWLLPFTNRPLLEIVRGDTISLVLNLHTDSSLTIALEGRGRKFVFESGNGEEKFSHMQMFGEDLENPAYGGLNLLSHLDVAGDSLIIMTKDIYVTGKFGASVYTKGEAFEFDLYFGQETPRVRFVSRLKQ